MAKFGGILRKFARQERGNVLMLFGLTLPPMLGAGGIAIDYARTSNVRSYMQSEADSAALSGARAAAQTVLKKLPNDKSALAASAVTNAQALASERYGAGKISGLAVTGKWLNDTDFEVMTSGKVKNTMSRLIPGSPAELEFKTRSVARVLIVNNQIAFKPAVASLDFEAGDYNRIYVYCFDKTRKNDPDKGRRVETMTAISDNGGTTYVYEMPVCTVNETLSYRLYNVRGMRTTKSRWDAGSAERFNHYTDSELDANGVASYDFKRGTRDNYGTITDFALKPDDGLLETVLCNTLAECKPKSQGGILPEGRNRTPVKETRACAEGKFMYYGWEDRPYYAAGAPPGVDGWTDRDYDDIRLIVECPRIPPEPSAAIKLID